MFDVEDYWAYQISHVRVLILSCSMRIIIRLAGGSIFHSAYLETALVRVSVSVLSGGGTTSVFAISSICEDDRSVICNSES